MAKTAFVCFGDDAGKNDLIYHELPRKGNEDEFFLFFSPGSDKQADSIRKLFRSAISISRLGSPRKYFSSFMDLAKDTAGKKGSREDVFLDSIIVIMLRRAEKVFILHNKELEGVYWDSTAAVKESIDGTPFEEEISIGRDGSQGDLFMHEIEDRFILRYFVVPGGKHTIVFAPSKDFAERHDEKFRNSIFFPSFEMPISRGIGLDTHRSFPAIHWDLLPRTVKPEPRRARISRAGRFSLPAAAGIATALVAIFLVFGPLNDKDGGNDESSDRDILLSAEDSEPAEVSEKDHQHIEPASMSKAAELSLNEIWKKKFEAPVTSSPMGHGDIIIFGCRDGNMYAFRTDGHLAWMYESGNGIGASPVCAGSMLIGANYSGDIFCLEIDTGKEIWRYSSGDKIVSSPAALSDLVLVGTMKGDLIALERDSGEKAWSQKIGTSIWASICSSEKYVYAATEDGSLVKLDDSGKIKWRIETNTGLSSSPICISDRGIVVIGTKGKSINAYSTENGGLVWRHESSGNVNGSPASNGNNILIGSEDGSLYSLNMRGELIWRTNLGGPIRSRPLISEDHVFVSTYSSKLVVLDIDSGEIISEYKADSPIYSSPSFCGGNIFFGSNLGFFYALELVGEGS